MTKENITKLREVPITRILGIDNIGRRISIPCPIHNGKNKNFNIYEDGSYYCFKCGAKGQNAIDFLMACGGTFIESIELLKKYV